MTETPRQQATLSSAVPDDGAAVDVGRREPSSARLPPGQRPIGGFPRFGAHLSRPAPAVPANPVIEIRGAVREALELPLAALADLPRRELTADFHCVAGWSATGLRWEGVPFAAFYRAIVEPALPSGTSITHVVCQGLDGWRSVLTIEDALADDVLLAEHLDGRPLGGDHGAPVRLVSPGQYGFLSTKHLCRVEVHTAEPGGDPSRRRLARTVFGHRRPRARVWEEERHEYLPARLLRPFYRSLVAPIRVLSARGSSAQSVRRVTEVERAARLPCDELVHDDAEQYDRALVVAALPSVVFARLGQLRAAQRTELAIGQPFGRILRLVPALELASFSPDEQITLGQRRTRPTRWLPTVTCTYALSPRGVGTRLHVRVRFEGPRLVGQALALGTLGLARSRLGGLTRLAGRTASL